MKKMMMAIAVLTTAFVSCDSDDMIGPEDLVYDLALFPHDLGDSWVYARTNNISSEIDTITVTIVGVHEVDCAELDCAGSLQEWEFRSGLSADTQWVYVTDTSINLCSYLSATTLMFPLDIGRKWSLNILNDDTTEVVGVETVTVPLGAVPFCYHVERAVTYLDTWEQADLWTAPNVGIVKMRCLEGGMLNPTDVTWELLAFGNVSPEPFPLEAFPTGEGSWWRYRIDNLITGSVRTGTVAVVDTSAHDDFDPGEFRCAERVDTHHVAINGNIVTYSQPHRINYTYCSIVFPFDVGDTWITYPLGATNTVSGRELTADGAGNFHYTHFINVSNSCGDECIHSQTFWYAQDVGMVKWKERVTDFGPQPLLVNSTWTLLGYHIAQ